MSQGTSGRRDLLGSQSPRIRVASDYSYTYGDDAAELADAYGLSPYPWQKLVLDDWLAYGDDDKYAHGTCSISVPRQNGKNGVLEVRELYGTAVEGEKILHTAHEVKTARKAFKRLVSFFDNEADYPELHALVDEIRRTNGQEAIVLKNGGSVEFSARSKGAARGFTVDVVVCDEAQELTDEQLNALLPTKSSAPLGNSQLILLGTPPDPNCHGTVFARTRKKAISGQARNASHLEWSVKEIGDVYDESRWEETNPSLGYLMERSAIEDELATMSEDGFARERLGWWADGVAGGCFDSDEWAKLAATFTEAEIEAQREWRLAYGVKFSIDGATAAIAVAIWDKGQTPHVEVLEHRVAASGIQWAVDFIADRWKGACTIAIDGKARASDFYDALCERGVFKRAMRQVNSDNVVTASSMMLNAYEDGNITHNAQPALDDAIGAARKRKIGTGGGFGFESAIDGVDVTPLEAASLALWGVRTSKRDPRRKAVAW